MKRYLGVWLLTLLFGCLDVGDDPIAGDDPIDPDEASQELTASSSASLSLAVNYNALAAVQYALNWATNNGVKRNPNYPDFKAEDCTNFVSQAASAGGVTTVDGGTLPCGYQTNPGLWYARRVLVCTVNPAGFSLSTTWSRVQEFWDYHRTHGAATKTFGNTSTELGAIRSKAQLGDILQGGGLNGWTHSMIVTAKSGGEISLTYHSGSTGLDVVNRALASIAVPGSFYNYRLISFYHSIP
jgi:hypothetical protein